MFDRHNRRHLSSSLSAQIIEYLRKSYSQVEIARMLHVSEAFVSLVKKRERSLTIDHLELLADALSMPLGAMLLVMTEPKQSSQETPERRERFAHLAKLCDKARDSILRASLVATRK
jgi:transcriptional regulator with XRE-family HTH domain